MAITTYLSIIEPIKQTKQTRRTETESWIQRGLEGRECGRIGEEVRGLKSTNRQLQNSHVDGKYSIRNGVAKELIHMTCGHDQWCRDCLRDWEWLGGGGKEGKIGTTVIAESIK